MSRRKPYEFEGPAPDAAVYWTSLDDFTLQQSSDPAARDHLAEEIPRTALDFSDGVSRRGFMTLMGAAVALATLEGCRRPVDKIMPYARMPEDVAVNVTSYYATVIDRRGESLGLLVESHEGRPTKIEGNPDHSASHGKTDLLAQAAVLDLYDPDRARQPSTRGEDKRYADAEAALQAVLQAQAANGGGGLRVLAQPTNSPTFVRLRQAVLRRFPNARFHTWERGANSNAREGARLAFGQVVLPVLALERARVIVSLDSDFLQTETGAVRNTRGFAMGRRPGEEMSRLYVVEPSYTITGANADHRLRLAAREVELYLRPSPVSSCARTASTSARSPARCATPRPRRASPRSGSRRSPATSPPTAAAPRWSSAPGSPPPSTPSRTPSTRRSATPVRRCATSPWPTATRRPRAPTSRPSRGDGRRAGAGPGDPRRQPGLRRPGGPRIRREAPLGAASFHLSTHRDETAERATWHIPRAHELEAWGDGQSLDGTVSIQQPLIQPLFQGRSEIEILALLADAPSPRGHDLVRETLRAARPRQWASTASGAARSTAACSRRGAAAGAPVDLRRRDRAAPGAAHGGSPSAERTSR
ncbi:MAG: hypothetical protein IPF99_18040 [Deltaproteobacteria bacterium]|nr:hypothetical protein [Deltaproteobacteria bacterium]